MTTPLTRESAERYQAWLSARDELVKARIREEMPRFITEMNDFCRTSSDNRPLLSPRGKLIAQVLTLLSILQSQAALDIGAAKALQDVDLMEWYSRVYAQTELAASVVTSIDVF